MNIGNYPSDWEKRRQNVFLRDHGKCVECGSKEYEEGVVLHCHHRQPISKGGGHELDNLETLCEDCHHIVHSNSGFDRLEDDLMVECEYDQCCSKRPKWEQNYEHCSVSCRYYDYADEALAMLEEDENVCATCFHDVSNTIETCPHCGAWDLNENMWGQITPENLAYKNLIANLVYYLDLYFDKADDYVKSRGDSAMYM